MGETNKGGTEPQQSQFGGKSMEEIKGSLLLEGFEGRDVEAVIAMTKDMLELNKLLFSDAIPIVYVDEDKSDKRRIASYREPDKSDGANEGYYIFMRGIVDNANFSMQNRKLWFDKDGKFKTGDTEPGGVAATFDEFMFGLAAHEVRHRVQQKPDFKKIDMTKDMERDYEDRESERDARIIGYRAMRALHNGKSMEQIAKIVGKIE